MLDALDRWLHFPAIVQTFLPKEHLPPVDLTLQCLEVKKKNYLRTHIFAPMKNSNLPLRLCVFLSCNVGFTKAEGRCSDLFAV